MAKDARFAVQIGAVDAEGASDVMPIVRRTPVPAAPVFERIKAAE